MVPTKEKISTVDTNFQSLSEVNITRGIKNRMRSSSRSEALSVRASSSSRSNASVTQSTEFQKNLGCGRGSISQSLSSERKREIQKEKIEAYLMANSIAAAAANIGANRASLDPLLTMRLESLSNDSSEKLFSSAAPEKKDRSITLSDPLSLELKYSFKSPSQNSSFSSTAAERKGINTRLPHPSISKSKFLLPKSQISSDSATAAAKNDRENLALSDSLMSLELKCPSKSISQTSSFSSASIYMQSKAPPLPPETMNNKPLPQSCHACYSTILTNKAPISFTSSSKVTFHRIKTFLDNTTDQISATEELDILRAHSLQTEKQACKDEIEKYNNELSALSSESKWIYNMIMTTSNEASPVAEDGNLVIRDDDVPSDPQRKEIYQRMRGFYFRFKMGSDSTSVTIRKAIQSSCSEEETKYALNAKEAFLSRCGAKEISKNISFVSLVGPSSFFIRRDNLKWYVHGTLPDNVKLKIKNGKPSSCATLTYLSVGPAFYVKNKNGTTDEKAFYYIEWSTGECCWVNFDPAFHDSITKMDVHRVAFGNDKSWIILGKDGRCTWRGISPRLERILKERKRNMPAACEVSLGQEGSYFVKFLDGEIDYFLPAVFANECEKLEGNGMTVCNISLRVDCDDFIIRHTDDEAEEVKRVRKDSHSKKVWKRKNQNK